MDNTDIQKRIATPQKYRPKVVMADGRGKLIGCVITAKLLPLRHAMLIGLHRLGYNTKDLKFKTIIILYYNEFVNNKTYSVRQFNNNLAFKIRENDDLTADVTSARIKGEIGIISEVVNAIIDVFKSAKLSYESLYSQGLNPKHFLSDEQFLQARAAIYIENKLASKSNYDHFVKKSDLRDIMIQIISTIAAFYILKYFLK